ncbi:MAG: cysteine--tRNA ligase [Desulfobacterales bacterium]|nr:cysteine--tRNA ligase [Desulfobacterales bacterium]
MAIRIYNTLSGRKENFETIKPDKVSMYVCGPTVYDSCHIGHARSVVVFDVIARYLKSQGYEVKYVRNFTDIDDKIINRANELNEKPAGLASRYIEEFHTDMDALYVERPSYEPKATDHINQIIDVINRLIEKNIAYEIDGDVYFSVDKFKGYGKLSGRKLEDMEAGARIDIDKRKKNPFDFALWKSTKPGEPFWPSPWGNGRPGWHIECSAMSCEYLGETFDIHGGGKDLIFPHHENEIAQSEAAFGKAFAKYWVHNGFVNINHEKMSKSLGNFLMIKDVIKRYHPEVVRFFLLSNHYRSPIDFTDKAMDEAVVGLDKIYALLQRLSDNTDCSGKDGNRPGDCWNRFCEAMDDDFNTAKGIGIIFDTVRQLNKQLDQKTTITPDITKILQIAYADLIRTGQVLGVFCLDPVKYFESKKSNAIGKLDIDEIAIEKLIKERIEARKAKNWAKADEARDRLSDMGIVIEDRPEGTIWRIKE